MRGVGISRQTADARQRVVDITAAIGVEQRRITTQGGSNANLLRAPVQIDSDLVLGKHYERPQTGVGVVDGLGMGIATCGSAEREK